MADPTERQPLVEGEVNPTANDEALDRGDLCSPAAYSPRVMILIGLCVVVFLISLVIIAEQKPSISAEPKNPRSLTWDLNRFGPPDRRVLFLLLNVVPSGLPLSYRIHPSNYFDKLPLYYRATGAQDKVAPECEGRTVSGANWDRFNWQTEEMLVTHSCNIYDGAVGSIALALSGYYDAATSFWRVLDAGRTMGMDNIRANAPCKGREDIKECVDNSHTGYCGLCYGDQGNVSMRSPNYRNAWFFRTLSERTAYPDFPSQLCPELHVPWTWVDYKAVLGDNAWATLTGPLHTLWLRYGGDPTKIPDNAVELRLALEFIPTVSRMVAGDTGGIYFCPHNTFYGWVRIDLCSQISVENNVSLLAGLKSLRYLLSRLKRAKYDSVMVDLDKLIDGITRFLRSAYDPEMKLFRTGGMYSIETKTLKWDPSDNFAVDCQTWTGTVLGSTLIDSWYGPGTTLNLWNRTKALAGYSRQPDGKVKGVGYTYNQDAQVCSGEWTYGAANWLMVMGTESTYSSRTKKRLREEAHFMATFVRTEMTMTLSIANKTVQGTQYANIHYPIPPRMGGWIAYPLPSRASTSWGLFWDRGYNPMHLLGKYSSTY